MSPVVSADSLASQIRGLTFDVFGTVVNWRASVESELAAAAARKVSSPAFRSLPADLRSRAEQLSAGDWSAFAAEWRASYGRFTRGFVLGVTEWKDIDTHHHDSLVELLDKWQLAGLYGPGEIRELSRVWHRLEPWPDAARGLHALGTRFITATLSNGNTSLLRDLDEFGSLGFQKLISAADFGAYKPHPSVYLGAVRGLELQPGQVAMVAAHLGDLEAAKSLGLKTIYVERAGEEELQPGDERYERARDCVDLWVGLHQDGFVEVARRLGVSRDDIKDG